MNFHCFVWTYFAAIVTAYTQLHIYLVSFMRAESDGVRWAFLCADGASYTLFIDGIGDQAFTFAGRTPSVDVFFIFMAEVLQRGGYRFWGCFAQAAEAPLRGPAR